MCVVCVCNFIRELVDIQISNEERKVFVDANRITENAFVEN